MDFIFEKINTMANTLDKLRVVASQTIDYEYIECPEYKKGTTLPILDESWKKAEKFQRFYGVDTHYWIHFTIDALEPIDGKEYRLCVKTGRENMWAASNPQIMIYIDGKNTQAMDVNHTWLAIECNKKTDVYMYLYAGMVDVDFGFEVSVKTYDIATEQLYYDILIPWEGLKCLDASSTDYIRMRDALDKATMLLDLRDVYSDGYYNSVAKCAEYLHEELYVKLGGNSDGVISCIGHTHIDVAWLWTVAQTVEKAQRSFATVISLMKRYDEYKFMSSQPQLYQYVKQEDPALYEEIKKYIAEGRWEAEGAMWLEADTNLVSGESLIRQIMHGKRFMQEEFGVDNRILWLPDVFGYSGALPQILKKTGVDRFFTTKMYWSETNKMPDDVFEWEGIDGSKVFTAFAPGYVNVLNPQRVKSTWDSFKNKSITDKAMFTFGYGDGGGGTTPEMMEAYKRMKYGLPGLPKTEMTFAGEYFDKVEADFYANTTKEYSRPKWVGEMYLEMHRGTYTSMAKNKKNNRRSEILLSEAEAVSATDMLLCGGEYPTDTLFKNQTTVLLNQFHDIIPGSSIKPVYDVTDVEYAEVIGESGELVDKAIDNIKSGINTDGGIFVYNPTPFSMSDYVNVGGKDYYAADVPAHGWKVIEDKPCIKEITVGDKLIENDVIKVLFDDNYHIVSVYDKECEREVIVSGEVANRLEVFEDYPRAYDAWEITDYYKQKMWVVDDVAEVTNLDNGLCISRKYGKSFITQKIVLTPGSKRIDFVTTVDWHEDHVLLKAAFPVDIRNTYATYDIQFGNLRRPTHANTSWDRAKFEVCAHKWADLSEDDYGVSIINDCKYGYSIEENVMKLSLLKCATYPNPEADRGINEFTYSFYPHEGDFKNGGTIQQGYLLNMPLMASAIDKGAGTLESCKSIMSSDSLNVIIETIKKAENDDSIVVRMYDAYNKKSLATITAGFDFKEVYLCDMLENNQTKLSHSGRSVNVPVKNFEIVTIKFVR